MKRIVIVALTVLALACQVEKTGQDTYKVTAPTPEAKAAAEKAKDQAKVIGNEAKEQAKTIGQEAKQGAADAAVTVGGALQKAGEKTKAEGKELKKKARATTTTRY
jgi:hypothetical protein